MTQIERTTETSRKNKTRPYHGSPDARRLSYSYSRSLTPLPLTDTIEP